MKEYDNADAVAYSDLGIENTTYEFSLKYLQNSISQRGPFYHCVDYGCGSGRSTRLLRQCVPESSIVIGADINKEMISQAKASSNEKEDIIFVLSSDTIPVPASSADLVICANVIEEFERPEDLMLMLNEINRILVNNGTFIIVSANPFAMAHKAQFKTYGYSYAGTNLTQGDKVTCTIWNTPIVFQDTYWPKEILNDLLEKANFKVESIAAPMPASDYIHEVRDEATVAPDLVWVCTKQEVT